MPPSADPTGTLRRLLGAPILHFTLLAGLLFALHAAFAPAGKPVITVDAGLVETLLAERAALAGRAQDERDRREVIGIVITEEILLREAQARGLDTSPRVRALLVQSARTALTAEVPPPTEADLRALYDADPARFARPAMVSLAQVFYPAPDIPPADLPAMLDAGGDPRGLGAIDPRAGLVLRRASEAELARAFDAAMAGVIMRIADGAWHGPLTSPRGVHFVRIEERWPGIVPDFDTLRPHLAEAWLAERRQQVVAQRIAELAAGYDVRTPSGQ